METAKLALGWNAGLTEKARYQERWYWKTMLSALVADNGGVRAPDTYQFWFFQGNDFDRLRNGHDASIYPVAFVGTFRYDWLTNVTLSPQQSPAGISSAESVTCVICGQSLEGKRGHAMTCSVKCRKALSRRKVSLNM